MLTVEIRFPMGVYHAQSSESFGKAEWPPSPVRLIGALLAAAHESPSAETEAGRRVLRMLCSAEPPEIVAPKAQSTKSSDAADGVSSVAEVRGASRWAPRNGELSEINRHGASFRDLAGRRAEVHKGGVVVGDQPCAFRWPEVELGPEDLHALRGLAEEVTFVGTSRSPAVVSIHTDEGVEVAGLPAWKPAPEHGNAGTEVRVPIPSLIEDFDSRHQARFSRGRKPLENSGHVPNFAMGATVPYMPQSDLVQLSAGLVRPNRQWGDMLVLELDLDSPDARSELWPKASAGYLVGRAFRSALLNTYGPVGSPHEAPEVLRGHGSQAHAAFVPLPHVGTVAYRTRQDGEREAVPADGLIRGLAVVLPHEARVPDVLEQRMLVEEGLRRFVIGDDRVSVHLPGAGRLWFKVPAPGRKPLRALQESRYREPSRIWQTVTPVVHSHRRTSSGPKGVVNQIAADCRFAGLPEPTKIEVLKDPPFAGAAAQPISRDAVPPAWRPSMDGPSSHLRLTFAQEIEGPVMLGRAAHFGLGLCLPAPLESPEGSLGSDEATSQMVRS